MKLSDFPPDDADDEAILDPARPIIDAHHHLWPEGARLAYSYDDYLDDLTSGHNVVGTVYVECMAAYRQGGDDALAPVGETEFVMRDCPLAVGLSVPAIAQGIVAFADLTRPDVARQTLAAHVELAGARLCGVRHNVVWHERSELVGMRSFPRHQLAQPEFRESLAEVARLGLSYDVWALIGQLVEVADLAMSLPELTIVLNHIGGPVTDDNSPRGRTELLQAWRKEISHVARCPNVFLKFGGLGMTNYGYGFESRATRPASVELAKAWKDWFDAALECFGPERIMFESNFPVDKQSFSYKSLWNGFKRLSANCAESEKSRLFSETAQTVYRLPIAP